MTGGRLVKQLELFSKEKKTVKKTKNVVSAQTAGLLI
jgi:hypothetical protein